MIHQRIGCKVLVQVQSAKYKVQSANASAYVSINSNVNVNIIISAESLLIKMEWRQCKQLQSLV